MAETEATSSAYISFINTGLSISKGWQPRAGEKCLDAYRERLSVGLANY